MSLTQDASQVRTGTSFFFRTSAVSTLFRSSCELDVAAYLGGFDKSGGLVPLLYLAERQRPKPANLNLNGS